MANMEGRDIWDQIELATPGEDLQEEMYEFLSAYADGECSPKERKLVEAYLAQNEEAQILLAEMRSQKAFVAGTSAEPPAWLSEAIAQRTFGRAPLWPRWTAFGTSLAAAACLAYVLFPSAKPILKVAGQAKATPIASNVPASPVKKRAAQPVPAERAPSRKVTTSAAAPKRDTPTYGEWIVALNSNGSELQAVANAPADKNPLPTVKKPSERPVVAATYEPRTSREEPPAPDPVALAAAAETEETGTVLQESKHEEQVSADAREKLRERLKKLNDGKKDIKESMSSK